MTTGYTEEINAVKSDLQQLKQDIVKLTKTAASDAQDNANELSARAKKKAKSASRRTREISVQSRDRAHQTVAANPLISLAATAGVALIVGALFARR